MLELEQPTEKRDERCGALDRPAMDPEWGDRETTYSETLAGLLADATHKHRFDSPFRTFELGVQQSYQETKLKNSFIMAHVNSVIDPNTIHATWTSGLVFNSTIYFLKDALQSDRVHSPDDAYRELVCYIVGNKCRLGRTEFYISPSPNSACKAEMCD